MKYDLLTVGFPIVEIMRKERGVSFEEPADFTGPYPSGDTCIVLDVASRLGLKCCFLGTAGTDAFSDVVLNRLERDGIDLSHVRKVDGASTAIVFVRYDKDGKREYLNVMEHTAFSDFNESDICAEAVKEARWIHFSGEVLCIASDVGRRKAMLRLLEAIPADSRVCLDPNFVDDQPGIMDIMKPFITRADLILPSEGEAGRMMGTDTDEEACRGLAAQGKTVVLKKGCAGCDVYTAEGVCHIPAFHIEEKDPTGCGDSFCAGFITGLVEGQCIRDAGTLANAAGALQAMYVGPMEGALYREEVDGFIRKHKAAK